MQFELDHVDKCKALKTREGNTIYLSVELLKKSAKKQTITYCQFYQFKLLYQHLVQDKQFLDYKKELTLSFDLTVEWLYLGKISKKSQTLPPLIGFKFVQNVTKKEYQFYSSNESILIQIQHFLQKRLNQINIQDYYTVVRKLNEGSFAFVYLLQHKQTGEMCAAKLFNKEKVYKQQYGKASLQNEIEMLRCFKHKNILALKEIFESEKSLYLITEYLQGPNLVEIIVKHQEGFSHSKSRKLFNQLIKIKQELNYQNIMHRDIKPENIMFRDKKGKELVLIDFGLAAHWDKDYLFPRCGTPGYVAPEIICNIKGEIIFDGRCDMFSIGCVMYQIFVGEPLFQGKNLDEIIKINKAFSGLDIQGKAMKRLLVEEKELLRQLLEQEPENRLTVEEALKWQWEIVDGNKIQSLQKLEEQKPIEFIMKCEKEINSNKKFEEEKKWIDSNNSISKQTEFSLELQVKNTIFGCLNVNTKPKPIKNQQLQSLISPGLLPKKPKLNRKVYRHGTIQKDYVICENNDESKKDNEKLSEYQ